MTRQAIRTPLVLALIVLAPPALFAAPTFNAELARPHDLTTDLGCLRGSQRAHRFPNSGFDAAAHERIMYDISPCTGGFIRGVNTETWKAWHADIAATGAMTGMDLDGSHWTYDPKAKRYTNQTTGKSCSQSSLRHVCGR
jgi:hypothetical protein